MSNIDPTAIKTAITNGATWSFDECLLVGSVNKYPAVSGGAWVLQDTPGDLIRERVFEMFQAGEVQPGGALLANGMYFSVVSVDGYCHLIDAA